MPSTLSEHRYQLSALAMLLKDEHERERVQERLPFAVSIVRDEIDLKRAVQIRQSAYARHLPEFAESLREPEVTDLEPGIAILLAASKVDNSPLGTMRIQTNEHKPLVLEQSIELPPHLRTSSLAEATRLGITQDRVGRLVKTALFKSFYQYCVSHHVEWMVVAGRHPIDRQYESLLFQDVVPGGNFIPLRHANNVPHRVMALEVASVEPRWHDAKHPLYDFFFQTVHPDLETEQAGFVHPNPIRPKDTPLVADPRL